jgi:trk system potassium uptake protein
MYVIVAGSGRLGSGLAVVLSSQGHDVVVVDESIDQKRLGNEFDGIAVSGSPIDEDILRKAGIEKSQLFVAATSDDNTNVMAIQIAKEIFHVPSVLARISDPDREVFYKTLGLNTVCPTTTGINQILNMIQRGMISNLTGFIDAGLVGVKPMEDWIGKPAGSILLPGDRMLIGIARGGSVAPLDPQRVVEEGDTLILVRNHRG